MHSRIRLYFGLNSSDSSADHGFFKTTSSCNEVSAVGSINSHHSYNTRHNVEIDTAFWGRKTTMQKQTDDLCLSESTTPQLIASVSRRVWHYSLRSCMSVPLKISIVPRNTTVRQTHTWRGHPDNVFPSDINMLSVSCPISCVALLLLLID